MTLRERIDGFAALGGFMRRHISGDHRAGEEQLHEGLRKVIETSHQYNNWFIPKFVNEAIAGIAGYLTQEDLERFSAAVRPVEPKTVAVIAAGNIPMVGFHDLLCVLLSGHRALIRLSADDNILLPFFLRLLTHYQPGFDEQIRFAEQKMAGFDAVIATGSNNTATHFQHYFGKYPHIIRRNRSSVAILHGDESAADLEALGRDIFLYFGLGCRNVSKLLVPHDYAFDKFFEAIHGYGFVVDNKKYGNNYDYYRAIYLLEQKSFLDNNFLMVKEDIGLHAPVSVLYYERRQTPAEISDYLEKHECELQCVVGRGHIPFGYSQQPVITDFADNIDTLAFLVNL